jgi:hypothetical protein
VGATGPEGPPGPAAGEEPLSPAIGSVHFGGFEPFAVHELSVGLSSLDGGIGGGGGLTVVAEDMRLALVNRSEIDVLAEWALAGEPVPNVSVHLSGTNSLVLGDVYIAALEHRFPRRLSDPHLVDVVLDYATLTFNWAGQVSSWDKIYETGVGCPLQETLSYVHTGGSTGAPASGLPAVFSIGLSVIVGRATGGGAAPTPILQTPVVASELFDGSACLLGHLVKGEPIATVRLLKFSPLNDIEPESEFTLQDTMVRGFQLFSTPSGALKHEATFDEHVILSVQNDFDQEGNIVQSQSWEWDVGGGKLAY